MYHGSKKIIIVFNIDNNNKKNVSWELNQHITISVGSCDCLKTGEIAAEKFSFDRINYILRYIKTENSYL